MRLPSLGTSCHWASPPVGSVEVASMLKSLGESASATHSVSDGHDTEPAGPKYAAPGSSSGGKTHAVCCLQVEAPLAGSLEALTPASSAPTQNDTVGQDRP